MIKQIKSSEIKRFIESNPNTILLDVRTEDEWNTVGKPDTKNLGIKSFFITISQDPSFLESVKQNIDKKAQTSTQKNNKKHTDRSCNTEIKLTNGILHPKEKNKFSVSI